MKANFKLQVTGMNSDKVKLARVTALVALPLLLSGCLQIEFVTQPATATAGDIITIEVEVSAYLDPDASGTFIPYFGVNYPDNWSLVGNPTYVWPSGTVVYDASKTAYMQSRCGEPGYTWWAGRGNPHTIRPDTLGASGIVTLQLQIDQCSGGTYSLDYMAGDSYAWGVSTLEGSPDVYSVWHGREEITVDNSFDATPPTSQVLSPSGTISQTSWLVTWSGDDDGCGLDYFDVQYRVNSGSWVNWRQNVNTTQGLFIEATPGATYDFRSRAADTAGNIEAYPSSHDVRVVVSPEAEPSGSRYYLPLLMKSYTSQSYTGECLSTPRWPE